MKKRTTRARRARRPAAERALAKLLRGAPPVPFGPRFFVTQLAAFLRDRCPSPLEGLPAVTLVLAGGETIDVCHVEGLSAQWLAIAAFDGQLDSGRPRMQSVILPYDAIARVTVRVVPPDASIGFRPNPTPRVEDEARYVERLPQGRVRARRSTGVAASRVRRPSGIRTPGSDSPGGGGSA